MWAHARSHARSARSHAAEERACGVVLPRLVLCRRVVAPCRNDYFCRIVDGDHCRCGSSLAAAFLLASSPHDVCMPQLQYCRRVPSSAWRPPAPRHCGAGVISMNPCCRSFIMHMSSPSGSCHFCRRRPRLAPGSSARPRLGPDPRPTSPAPPASPSPAAAKAPAPALCPPAPRSLRPFFPITCERAKTTRPRGHGASAPLLPFPFRLAAGGTPPPAAPSAHAQNGPSSERAP